MHIEDGKKTAPNEFKVELSSQVKSACGRDVSYYLRGMNVYPKEETLKKKTDVCIVDKFFVVGSTSKEEDANVHIIHEKIESTSSLGGLQQSHWLKVPVITNMKQVAAGSPLLFYKRDMKQEAIETAAAAARQHCKGAGRGRGREGKKQKTG
jgi:hypothetical protein